ncbi:MAG: hypothetical protein P8K27_03700 [Gammaproteobacteria bacterium]|nr:hypothetical protein [Gammaproteobacteria bacterium]
MEDNKSGMQGKTSQRKKKKTNIEKEGSQKKSSSRKSVDSVKKKSKKSSEAKKTSSKVRVETKTLTPPKRKSPPKKQVQPVMAEKKAPTHGSDRENFTLENKSASQLGENPPGDFDKKDSVEPGEKSLNEPFFQSSEQSSSRQVADSTSIGGLYSEEILFLKEEHVSVVDKIVSCLESDAPFCFINSEKESYLDYYKEIVIDLLKRGKKTKLLYFDPKFGDDLSSIINKELEEIDIGLIGSSRLHESRKILIIDNENFSNRLDWELIDSLRVELKSANIGVFSIGPNFLDDGLKSQISSIISRFNTFTFSKLKKVELKELKEYISKRPDKEKLLDILGMLLSDAPGKASEGTDSASNNNRGIWRKARDYIFRK